MAILDDTFTTDDAAPITSPRNSEPGPGRQTTTDTESKIGISGSTLVFSGGKATPAWNDPATYWDDGSSAYERGTYFQFTFKSTTIGYVMHGVSNSTTLGLTAIKHALFVVSNQRWHFRDVGDSNTAPVEETVAMHVNNVTYTLRLYVASGGGCLWLIQGGHFGSSWRSLAFSAAQSDSSIYPVVLNNTAALEIDDLVGEAIEMPGLYYTYWNGKTQSVDYQIGRGVSHDGISIGRDVRNPVMSSGTGWESTYVKDPFVLQDGNTYKMWYTGNNGSNSQIGYATSSDGITWSKSGSNPVVPLGTTNDFDETGCAFPIVYKDAGAVASKRYRMIYNGKDSSNVWTIGYAYSTDGVTWNKGASNPVVDVGSGGEADDSGCIAGSLVKDDSTYYLFYGMRANASLPVDDQIGLVTFTDFEGTYTKDGDNPIISNRTGTQALTATLNVGDISVSVSDSSGFSVGEYILLFNTTPIMEHNAISAIPSGTSITLQTPVTRQFTTGTTSKINASLRALSPRCVVKENGTWKMWGTAFHNGASGSSTETQFYATSSYSNTGWSVDWDNTPPLHLACEGYEESGWDTSSAENLVFVLDAVTYQRIGPIDLDNSPGNPDMYARGVLIRQ